MGKPQYLNYLFIVVFHCSVIVFLCETEPREAYYYLAADGPEFSSSSPISVKDKTIHSAPSDDDSKALIRNISSNAYHPQQHHTQHHTQEQELSPLFHATHVGFSKCGTSSFLSWFNQHPELFSTRGETKMFRKDYEFAVQQLEQMSQDYQAKINRRWKKRGRTKRLIRQNLYNTTNYSTNSSRLKIVTKDPAAVYRDSDMELLRTRFSTTKVIVGIRHPILWFLSFYNFRTIDRPDGPLPSPLKLIGPCDGDGHVCTDHARFHTYLAQALRKTPMTSPRELQLLYRTTDGIPPLATTKEGSNIHQQPSPLEESSSLQVFFYETQQLADKNETRSQLFRRDLANFLELNQTFPNPPKVKPEERLGTKRLQRRSKHLIQNFCEDQYAPIRTVLLQHARDVADWLQEFFLLNNDGSLVVSSPDFLLLELIESYRSDPLKCDSSSPKAINDW